MEQHPSDIPRYERVVADQAPVTLAAEQVRALDERARAYRARVMRHPGRHDVLTVGLILGLLALDVALVAVAGRLGSPWAGVALAALAHGYLTYSLTIYTMHEGAGHDLLILGRSPVARAVRPLANQTCRLFFADPVHYAAVHPTHHGQLGTAGDRAYTHYVAPERFARSLLPLAGLLPFNDYVIHTDHSFSRSHVRSLVVGGAYHVGLAVLLVPGLGWLRTLLVLVVLAPWVAFTLDRVRETYDHLFTPVHRRFGARSLGLGGAGMVFGGGPWGQPCHLAHHFAPGLPWYLQLRLHLDFRRLLTPAQRAALLTPGPVAFARTYARNLRLMRRAARLVP